MSEDEMLRLACIYAERDQLELLDAWEHCNDRDGKKVKREIIKFLKKLRAYRSKRWGMTKLEKACEDAESRDVLLDRL